MKIAELTLFSILVQERSLSEAAATLGISQPRASQLLSSLEQEVGGSLFVRTRSGVEPTSACLAFAPFAEGMLRVHRQGLLAAQGSDKELTGELRIGIAHRALPLTLAQTLSSFHKFHENVAISIAKASHSVLISDVEQGFLDACICLKPRIPTPLKWQALYNSEFVGVRRPYAPFSPVRKTLAQFVTEPLLLPAKDCPFRGLVDSAFYQLEMSPFIRMEIDDVDTTLSAVRQGTGVAFVPRDFARGSRVAAIDIVEPTLRMEVGVLRPAHGSAPLDAFCEVLALGLE